MFRFCRTQRKYALPLAMRGITGIFLSLHCIDDYSEIDIDMNDTATPPQPVMTILYDGQCPLCSREIAWLRNREPCQLAFQDVHADGFDPTILGVSLNDLLAEIHGINAEGALIKGIDVFAIAYSVAGLAWLAAPMRWSWSHPLLKWLYAWFARYRTPLAGLWFGKSCQNGQCRT